MNESSIQKLPQQAERVETGTVQFGDDWPGVFIRGDNALYYAFMLNMLLNGELPKEDAISHAVLKGLVSTLSDCNMANHRGE